MDTDKNILEITEKHYNHQLMNWLASALLHEQNSKLIIINL